MINHFQINLLLDMCSCKHLRLYNWRLKLRIIWFCNRPLTFSQKIHGLSLFPAFNVKVILHQICILNGTIFTFKNDAGFLNQNLWSNLDWVWSIIWIISFRSFEVAFQLCTMKSKIIHLSLLSLVFCDVFCHNNTLRSIVIWWHSMNSWWALDIYFSIIICHIGDSLWQILIFIIFRLVW